MKSITANIHNSIHTGSLNYVTKGGELPFGASSFFQHINPADMNLKEDLNGEAMCRCDNCGSVLINKNPRDGAKKYDIRYADGSLRHFVDLSDNGISHDIGYYWGCPNCETNEYLTDL